MKNTKHVLVIAILVCCRAAIAQEVCPPPKPFDEKAALGSWRGHYTSNGELREILVEFRRVNEKLVAMVDMPGTPMKRAQFETRVCSSNELHLVRTTSGEEFEIICTFNSEKISGRIVANKNQELIALSKLPGRVTGLN